MGRMTYWTQELADQSTIAVLVEVVTLLLGEHPQWDQARAVLFEAAKTSGHLAPKIEPKVKP